MHGCPAGTQKPGGALVGGGVGAGVGGTGSRQIFHPGDLCPLPSEYHLTASPSLTDTSTGPVLPS